MNLRPQHEGTPVTTTTMTPEQVPDEIVAIAIDALGVQDQEEFDSCVRQTRAVLAAASPHLVALGAAERDAEIERLKADLAFAAAIVSGDARWDVHEKLATARAEGAAEVSAAVDAAASRHEANAKAIRSRIESNGSHVVNQQELREMGAESRKAEAIRAAISTEGIAAHNAKMWDEGVAALVADARLRGDVSAQDVYDTAPEVANPYCAATLRCDA